MRWYKRSPFISRSREKKEPVFWFLLPSLIGVTGFVLLPFLEMVRRSFVTAVTGAFCGISNYQKLWENQAFLLAAKNTLRFTGVAIPCLIFCSFFLAFGIQKSSQALFLKSAYLFPLAVPTATVVLIWKMLFFKGGLLNQCLGLVGVKAIDWLGSDASFWVLVLSYIWKNLGYTVVLWLAGLGGIPESRLEAARVDGAGKQALLIYIVIPAMKPVLFTVTILSVLNSFKVFREAYLVAGAYPQQNMYLIQHLFNNWFTNLDVDKMAAAAVCIAVIYGGLVTLLKHFWEQDVEE